MGYRIHRAMGWGMPINKFEDFYTGPADEYGVTESLYELFNKLTDADLTVDDYVYRALFYGDGLKPHPICQKRLLAAEYNSDIRDYDKIGSATDLFAFVSTPDETTDVIFFPNLYYRSRWCRWDDDLDFAFERYRSNNDDNEPRDFTRYVRFGHYPWTNDLMDINGNPVHWDHYTALNQRTDWLAAVPSEIRWYLTQYGVMTQQGVNELRPVIAQWWS